MLACSAGTAFLALHGLLGLPAALAVLLLDMTVMYMENYVSGANCELNVGFVLADALFGLIAEMLKEAGEELQSPMDIITFLSRRLLPTFQTRAEDFRICYVSSARDVESMLPWQLRMEGAYATVRGIQAPHSFMFVPRSGLH